MSLTDLLRKIFISPGESRLRAGWRLLVQQFLMLVVMLMVVIPVGVVVFLAPQTETVLLLLASDIPMVVSVWAARVWVDRRSLASLGLRLNPQAVKDVIIGTAIAAVQIAFLFVLLLAFGWLQLDGFAWEGQAVLAVAGWLLIWLALFALVGFAEELFSRGYQLQNLEVGLNSTFWAVVLSSGVFGLLHITNPNATLVSVLGVIFAGLFLAYPYLRTRQLWMSIGMHLGWNYFLGPVFGFPVSGITTFQLFKISVGGPKVFTGGEFGPEAGLVVLPALAIGALLVTLVTRGRNPEIEELVK